MALMSMTGFADRAGVWGGLSWVWEGRSVNGRGLDVRVRLPEGCEGLEAPIRAAVGKAFARGSVSVGLRTVANGSGAGAFRLNEAALELGDRGGNGGGGRGGGTRVGADARLAGRSPGGPRRARGRWGGTGYAGGGAGSADRGHSTPAGRAGGGARDGRCRACRNPRRADRQDRRADRGGARHGRGAGGAGGGALAQPGRGAHGGNAGGRRGTSRPGACDDRGEGGPDRGDRPAGGPCGGGARADRRRRAGGAQARLPHPGVQPRGQYAVLQGAGGGISPQSGWRSRW